MMTKEHAYVDYFYEKYQGRIAIGVGYKPDMTEIYPLIFQTSGGESIGIVALGVMESPKNVVHIYHLGAFISQLGNGSVILKEICLQADNFNVSLSVSAIVMPNGKNRQMGTGQLVQWYKSFGFTGNAGLLREPGINILNP